ncbi:conjugal transfer protein TraM [Legionella anisa]|uniref:Conjugal transfer protein TraM n=1 Tax=Legionella anisa TaxID=28082 RepID=A0AAX0WP18_9GAMM|nr:conjugal transfer protein TraM [Legionella anisa]AWN73027.1 conjugal transfer protein TraM [Legionella anisa]KTC75657.1 traM protein [Legionella anisa]MBN5937474.1 conjugal transfer protein TraM [Legionella anisa]MCW8423848.1 conjugal transfer protein TraM [Legionella anisa]MCW8447370.1 conjugal transfer protein TraM [Legionella anisa]
MNDKFDTVMQEIAVKHGVVLSKDDPILILQTMNDRLIKETQQAQAAVLAQFREEIESISSQWKDDAREKAEKILNMALASSKEAMTHLLHEATNESVSVIKKVISDSVTQVHVMAKQTKNYSLLALFCSVLVVSCIHLVLFLI